MLTEINDLITGPDASEWVQKHKGTIKDVKLAMYLLKCYNNILHVLGKASQDVLQHQIALSQDWTPIDKKPMLTAKQLHAKALKRATEVFEGTITPPECTLWEKSLAKQGVNNRAIASGSSSGRGGGGLTTKNISPADAGGNKKRSSAGGDLIDRATKQRKTHNDPDNLGEDGLNGYRLLCTP